MNAENLNQKRQRTMHILIVSQYFFPEQFRINDLCLELVRRGHKVSVLTGIPNYPQGEFFDGYSLFKRRHEHWQGVDIIRIPIFSRGKSSIRLILNYFSFVASGLFWKIFTPLKADIVFVYGTSPILQAYPGLWFANKRKIPIVLYIMDLWPDSVQMVSGIRNRSILKALDRMVSSIYRQSRLILTSSKSFKQIILQRGVPEAKIEFWPQYAEDFYRAVEPSDLAIQLIKASNFNIIFTGNIGQAQGLSILVDCAQLLKEQKIEVCFNLVGDGRYKETLKNKIIAADLSEYFNLIEKQAAEEIPGILAACDVALICLEPNPLFEATIPAKLQSYMACSKAILVSADGEAQTIVNIAACGLCAKAGDAAALAEQIQALRSLSKQELQKLGESAYHYAAKHFERTKIIDQFEEILLTLKPN